jgi:hypothetical protein
LAFVTLTHIDPVTPFAQLYDTGVRNFTIHAALGASGVYGFGTPYGRYEDIRAHHTRHGMLLSDVFGSFLSRIRLESTRFGLAIVNQGESITAQAISIGGGGYLMITAGVSGSFTGLLFSSLSPGYVAALLNVGSSITLQDFLIDDESYWDPAEDPTVPITLLHARADMISMGGALTVLGGMWITKGSPRPPIYVIANKDRGVVTVMGSTFSGYSEAAFGVKRFLVEAENFGGAVPPSIVKVINTVERAYDAPGGPPAAAVTPTNSPATVSFI